MSKDFMLKPKGLNMFSLPGKPSQIACRIVTAVVVIVFVIVVVGLVSYFYLAAELGIREVDKAATDILEKIEKDNKEIEEMRSFRKFQERKANREFRELQGR